MEVNNLKKKIAVLKKAIVKERSDNQLDLSEIEELQQSVQELEDQLQVKQKELSELQMRCSAAESVEKLETELVSLNEQHELLKQELRELRIEQIPRETPQIQQLEALSVTLQTLTEHKEEIEEKVKAAESDKASLSCNLQSLEEELHELQEKLQNSEDEIDLINRDIQEKQGLIASLNDSLLSYADNESLLTYKLMQFKNKLSETENYYQRHEVTIVGQTADRPGALVLRRDCTADFVIEITCKDMNLLHSLRDIDSVLPDPHFQNRLKISFLDNSKVELESEQAADLGKRIRSFLLRMSREIYKN